MSDVITYQIQIHADEPTYTVFDFRGSRTPVYVYQDMQRGKAIDLRGARVCVDLGANVGMWCFRMAKMYPTCKFIAYEPFPENFKHLEMGITENDLHNIKAINTAVTEDGREIELFMDPTNSGSASMYNAENTMFPKAKVRSVSLAHVVSSVRSIYGPIDMLKVDIEGAEFHLFNGFNDWDKIKKIYLEVHPVFLVGTDEEKRASIKHLINLLQSKLGAENVFVDCTDEKFRSF